MANERCIGFFWTYPVAWASFKKLPKDDLDAAAAASRTIRYQRARIEHELEQVHGTMADVVVMMTDQAYHTTGDSTEEAIDRLERKCRLADARPIFLDFSSEGGLSRKFHLLTRAVERLDGHPVAATPAIVDGVLFDPFAHFENWRSLDRQYQGDWQEKVPEAFVDALGMFTDKYGRWKRIAEHLNGLGLKSKHAKKWDADMVRKAAKPFLKDGELDEAPAVNPK